MVTNTQVYRKQVKEPPGSYPRNFKKSNTDGGISFVRIGIEENTIDSDDEVEDEKEVNKVVKNDEVAVTEIVVDNAPKITSDTIRDDAYTMYEAESDVWELDD